MWNPVLALDYFAEWVCAEINYTERALKLNNMYYHHWLIPYKEEPEIYYKWINDLYTYPCHMWNVMESKWNDDTIGSLIFSFQK